MQKRVEAVFTFQGREYIAYVLIKENEKGYTYIVNLFDKELNKAFRTTISSLPGTVNFF